jgi:hypothetical protein
MGNQYLLQAKLAARLGMCPLLATVLAGAVVFAAVDDDEESSGVVLIQRRQVLQVQRALKVLLQTQASAGGFKHQLTTRLRHLDLACHLSEPQKRKLALAAEGDIKRYEDAFEDLRAQCRELQPDDPARSDKLIREISALQQQQADPFSAGSLFGKTLNQLLDREQLAKLARQPSRDAYERLVAGNLPALGNRIGLRPEQYPALTELLTWGTDPPKKFGRFEYMYLVYQLSKVPADKLKPLLDNQQQARLAQQYVANAEPFLIQMGLLDESARADEPAELLPTEDQPGAERPAQSNEVRQ